MAELTEIETYLWQLWEAKGTDLLFTVGIPPMLRVDGMMRPAEGAQALGPDDTERIVTSLLPPEVAEEFLKEKDADFSFGWEDRARFRANAFVQREVGIDTSSFVRGIRSALRADPDVLLVGEMRDLDTIQTTLTMAETGHLVLGTLHTNDTSQAVDRLVDVFPTGRQAQIRVQLANSLTGIIYQQLLPRIGGGQVAAFEVLVATHATRSLIRDGKSNQLRNVLLTGQNEGMQTLELALSDLVTRGLVTYDEALGRSLYPKELAKPPAVPVPAAGTSAAAR